MLELCIFLIITLLWVFVSAVRELVLLQRERKRERERERGARRQKKNLAINIQGGKENQERHAKGRKEKKRKLKERAEWSEIK